MKWPAWAYRLVPYLGRRQADEDLQEDLELERERQRDAGVPDADARRAARRRLGNGTLIRERTRDVWGWRWLDDLGRDMRHALRGLGRSPGFAAAVVLVLALGIGANTAMFGIVHGMLLRPLPYPEADAIVRIGESRFGTSGVSEMRLSNRSMPLLEESAASFEQLAAYQERSVESASLDGATLSGARVSPSLFPLLRSTPHLGRLFTEEEARVGADRVVLLSHGAWTRRFASDPDIVGTVVDLDGDPHTVVGVLAEGFYFPNPDGDRARAALAIAQVALTLVLLIGAGLLLRSFVRLVTFDRGYDPANAVTTMVRNPMPSRPSTTREAFLELRATHLRLQEQLLDEMTSRLGPLPEVDAFGLSWSLPFETNRPSSGPLRVSGTPMPSDPNEMVLTELQVASPGYLEAMGFRLRDGRTLTRADGPESRRVLVANETLARELFGDEPAVGRLVLIADRDEPWEVVGVVGDIVYGGLDLAAEPRAEAFFPLAQIGDQRFFGFRSGVFVTLRTRSDPLAAIPFLREAATAANPQATLGPVMTMESRLSAAVAQPRFYAVFVGSFAGLALLLAAFGIYGLLSYTVAQRRGEIGIRMALGARRGDILGLVVRQGAALVVAGGVIGVIAAAASSRVLESILYGVTTDDLLAFVAGSLVLVVAALAACWLPARRASRVEPMQALRFE